MRFRTIQAAPLMQMPVFLILFFAPVYVPLELLEGWIEGVASVNPVTYLLETGRGFVAGDAPHVAGAFAIAIGLGLASGCGRSSACGTPRRPAPEGEASLAAEASARCGQGRACATTVIGRSRNRLIAPSAKIRPRWGRRTHGARSSRA